MNTRVTLPGRGLRIALTLLLTTLAACGGAAPGVAPKSALSDFRQIGPTTTDADVAGRWLLAESLERKGDAAQAAKARARLDEIGKGGWPAHLARALDDSVHGKLGAVSEHYLRAATAARRSDDELAPMVSWYALHWAVAHRHSASPGLWKRWRPFVEESLEKPLGMGWRARGELVDWWLDEAWDRMEGKLEKHAAKMYGCVTPVRLAGPFGRNAPADSYRSFPAEEPGPWPQSWATADGRTPRVVKTDQTGCAVSVDEPTFPGVFYSETFLDAPATTNILLSVQGAVAIWVDDHLVLNRDPRKWGVWPRFGVALRVGAGRHRVLAKLVEPSTTVRAMKLDGTGLGISASIDPAAPYAMVPPERLADPNAIMRYLEKGRVKAPKDALTRFLAAELAHIEGQDDVSSVLIEPLVLPTKDATGPTLLAAAKYIEGDPIYDKSKTEDLVNSYHRAAAKKDPGLWAAQISVILADAGRKTPTEAVRPLAKLAKQFPEVAPIALTLARLYGELGWDAERVRSVKALAKRFPNNLDVLYAAAGVYRQEGDHATADKLAITIQKIDPDSEIRLDLALRAQDYEGALKELKRLGKRRPEREDIAERIHDVMVRAGNREETWKKLEAAVEKSPKDVSARLALADARYASGKRGALRDALIGVIEAGGKGFAISEAIDLLSGVTELEPYRVDAKKVIEKYENSGQPMPGTAARVLDYTAVLIRSDGSSRRLSHEVVKIQSPEAVGQFAEHRPLEGIVLTMRVIKADGQILEPTRVSGKPTLTFPHLEVGDYVETEHIASDGAISARGVRYLGPRWFFREERVAYFRSEFVVVSPESKKLLVETRGNVPAPEITRGGGRVTRRWIVRKSPAAPVEPLSAPAAEFLPSVHVGWGIKLSDRLLRLNDSVADTSPMDPRVSRIARKIVSDIPKKHKLQRVKTLYRWILDNVEDGEESDGRRVIVGKSGNRWRGFMTLCRAIGVKTEYVLAESRIASPPVGPLSEAGRFTQTLLVVDAGKKSTWLSLGSKYAPFGYVPELLQGSEAYRLGGKKPVAVKVPRTGMVDRIEYEGQVQLMPNGSAKLTLIQRFRGKYAIGLRTALAGLPEARLRDVIESQLLGRILRGARLVKHEIRNRDKIDAPLELEMTAEMSVFAQRSGGALVIAPPFAPRVSQLAALPERRTPLLIGDPTRQRVKLTIKLPPGASVDGKLAKLDSKYLAHSATVLDRLEGRVLTLERDLVIAAGRVQPAKYGKFQKFTRSVDEAALREIRILVR